MLGVARRKRRGRCSSYSNRLGVSTECCICTQFVVNLRITGRLTLGRADESTTLRCPPNRSSFLKPKKANPSNEGWLCVGKFSDGHTAATDVENNLLVGCHKRPVRNGRKEFPDSVLSRLERHSDAETTVRRQGYSCKRLARDGSLPDRTSCISYPFAVGSTLLGSG